jgi:hypothetical protein
MLLGRKQVRSEPSALKELNNEHNDGNHEQKMNQSAAKVPDKAQKPEHHEYYNYSPEHNGCFFRLG